jgi:hypothetical protein
VSKATDLNLPISGLDFWTLGALSVHLPSCFLEFSTKPWNSWSIMEPITQLGTWQSLSSWWD